MISSTSSHSTPLLQAKNDRYDGVIIDPACLPADEASFVASLRASLDSWKSQHKKGIWLKLPIQNSNLVNAAVKEGFEYHHAEREYLMLTYWIPEIPTTIPANASHRIGVGAFVINDKRQVLVVQERTGPTQGSGIWKVPTGVVNQAEDIIDAVEREVKEETGVDAEFSEVLGFRQSHDALFGKSDIFVLCMLQPKSLQIVPQESEIESAKWMPLEEFRHQSINTTSTMLSKMVEVATASIEEQYKGFSPEKLSFGIRGKGSYFFYNKEDIKEYNRQTRHSSVNIDKSRI